MVEFLFALCNKDTSKPLPNCEILISDGNFILEGLKSLSCLLGNALLPEKKMLHKRALYRESPMANISIDAKFLVDGNTIDQFPSIHILLRNDGVIAGVDPFVQLQFTGLPPLIDGTTDGELAIFPTNFVKDSRDWHSFQSSREFRDNIVYPQFISILKVDFASNVHSPIGHCDVAIIGGCSNCLPVRLYSRFRIAREPI